jgi:hypothetical protein
MIETSCNQNGGILFHAFLAGCASARVSGGNPAIAGREHDRRGHGQADARSIRHAAPKKLTAAFNSITELIGASVSTPLVKGGFAFDSR